LSQACDLHCLESVACIDLRLQAPGIRPSTDSSQQCSNAKTRLTVYQLRLIAHIGSANSDQSPSIRRRGEERAAMCLSWRSANSAIDGSKGGLGWPTMTPGQTVTRLRLITSMFESCWAHQSFQALTGTSKQRRKTAVVDFVDVSFLAGSGARPVTCATQASYRDICRVPADRFRCCMPAGYRSQTRSAGCNMAARAAHTRPRA
jgi:hypothetical protein